VNKQTERLFDILLFVCLTYDLCLRAVWTELLALPDGPPPLEPQLDVLQCQGKDSHHCIYICLFYIYILLHGMMLTYSFHGMMRDILGRESLIIRTDQASFMYPATHLDV
jgi:hypothetical protein